jgi:hypothetical protein
VKCGLPGEAGDVLIDFLDLNIKNIDNLVGKNFDIFTVH